MVTFYQTIITIFFTLYLKVLYSLGLIFVLRHASNCTVVLLGRVFQNGLLCRIHFPLRFHAQRYLASQQRSPYLGQPPIRQVNFLPRHD